MQMEHYAMYLRKSRADLALEALGEGETLARHKTMLLALAEKYEIPENAITEYHEIVSGESIQDRPEMQRLLEDVYRRKYVGVLVVEVERLARGNTKDQGEVANAFQYSSTKIITPAKIYDPNNEFDQEYFEFGLFMSRREYKTIRRRLEAGRQQSVQEGNYVGARRLYGYDIVRKSKRDRILVPIPEEAEVVKMVFTWAAYEKIGPAKIASRLNAMGVKATLADEWSRSTIRSMLQNVHYIGQVRWYTRTRRQEYDGSTGALVKKYVYDKQAVRTYPGKHEPIISEELFQAAQAAAALRNPPTKSACKLSNPFAGLLHCKHCGKSLRYQPYPSGPPWLLHETSSLCHIKSVKFEQVSDSIINALTNYIQNYTVAAQQNNDNTAIVAWESSLNALHGELEKAEKRRQRLFDAFEDGVYDRDEFLERKAACNHAIDEIRAKINATECEKPVHIDYAQKITDLHAMINCIKSETTSADDKNRFLRQFISDITLDTIDLGDKKGATPVTDVRLK